MTEPVMRSTRTPGLFDSAWMKWGWAVKHGQLLHADIERWAANPDGETRFGVAHYYDPKRHCIVLHVDRIAPLPPHWGLRVGDAVHDFRSCLDHIAWALVQRGRTPPDTLAPEQQRRIGFPIYSTNPAFKKSLPKMLPGVRRADIALVRLAQPYRDGKRQVPRHAFTTLHHFSNLDKHREVQPVLALPENASYVVSETRDCTVTRMVPRMRRKPLDIGTELALIFVRKTGPDPDIEVKGAVAAEPMIENGLGGYVRAGDWFATTATFTRSVLMSFQNPPQDIAKRLGDAP